MNYLTQTGEIAYQVEEILIEQEDMLRNNLLHEILMQIFSHLNDETLPSTMLVSHFWKKLTVDSVQQKKLLAIFKKLDEVNKFTDEHDKEEALPAICEALMQIGCIDKAIEIAYTIPAYKVHNLFAPIYTDNSLTYGPKREAFLSICTQLVKIGNIDKAIKIAFTIPHKAFDYKLPGLWRDMQNFLLDRCRSIVQSGDIDKAIEFIDENHEKHLTEDARGSALKHISEALINNGEINKAIKIAHRIPSVVDMKRALCNILEVVTSQPDSYKKGYHLSNIYKKCQIRGDREWCLWMDFIENGLAIKVFEVIIPVCLSLTQKGNIDDAMNIAKLHSDEAKGKILWNISKTFLTLPYSKNEDKLANLSKKGEVLAHICKELIQSNNIDLAIEVAHDIPIHLIRMRISDDIFKFLIQENHIDKAIEAANNISAHFIQMRAFENIFDALIQKDRFDKAIEVANMRPDPLKFYALEDICKAYALRKKTSTKYDSLIKECHKFLQTQ
jgi:tetratricopeptide (TPR) repeat protein